MNPIIVLGMVGLISLGLYGIYSGMAQQAELGEIQRDMLEQYAGIGDAALIRGEMINDTVTIRNFGGGGERLLQIRGFDTDGAFLKSWEYRIDIPAHGEILLESLPAVMTQSNVTILGVLDTGMIFPIERTRAGNTIPDGAYGPVSVMVLDGGSSARLGSGAVVSYYYSEEAGQCKSRCFHAGCTVYLWEKRIIYDEPFLVTGGGLTGTPKPKGSPVWHDWVNLHPLTKHKDRYSTCGSLADDYPAYLVPVQDEEYVYAQTGVPSWDLDMIIPISGETEVEGDGTLIIRVEGSVEGIIQAEYDWSNPLSCMVSGAYPPDCDCSHTLDGERIKGEERRGEGLGISYLAGRVRVTSGGAPVGTFVLSGIPPVESIHSEESRFYFDEAKRSGSGYACWYRSDGHAYGAWTHDSEMSGWIEVPVNSGDAVNLDVEITLSYSPPHSAGIIRDTHGSLEVGDLFLTIGWKDE